MLHSHLHPPLQLQMRPRERSKDAAEIRSPMRKAVHHADQDRNRSFSHTGPGPIVGLNVGPLRDLYIDRAEDAWKKGESAANKLHTITAVPMRKTKSLPPPPSSRLTDSDGGAWLGTPAEMKQRDVTGLRKTLQAGEPGVSSGGIGELESIGVALNRGVDEGRDMDVVVAIADDKQSAEALQRVLQRHGSEHGAVPSGKQLQQAAGAAGGADVHGKDKDSEDEQAREPPGSRAENWPIPIV